MLSNFEIWFLDDWVLDPLVKLHEFKLADFKFLYDCVYSLYYYWLFDFVRFKVEEKHEEVLFLEIYSIFNNLFDEV